MIEAAIEAARGKSIFLVTAARGLDFSESELGETLEETQQERQGLGSRLLRQAQPEFEVVYQETFRGLEPLSVVQLQERQPRS